MVPDFIDDGVITMHYRGNSVFKITSSSFIRDRVRFSFDGYRRQRLVYPMVCNKVCDWSYALFVWWNLVYQQGLKFVVDPVQPYSNWIYYLLSRLSFSGDRLYSIDVNRKCTIYHGSFGLQTVNSAFLVLPVCTPHEEYNLGNGFKIFSLSVFQMFKPKNFAHDLSIFDGEKSYSNRVACLQVSPLQRFLVD